MTEGQEEPQIVENSSLLCSYFVILESCVVFVCQQSDLTEGMTTYHWSLYSLHTCIFLSPYT